MHGSNDIRLKFTESGCVKTRKMCSVSVQLSSKSRAKNANEIPVTAKEMNCLKQHFVPKADYEANRNNECLTLTLP